MRQVFSRIGMMVSAGTLMLVLTGLAGPARAEPVSDDTTAVVHPDRQIADANTPRETLTQAPDDISRQLAQDAKYKYALFPMSGLDRLRWSYKSAKDMLYKQYGLSFGLFYTALYQQASGAVLNPLLGAGVSRGSSGTAELLAKWELVGRDTQHPGSLAFRLQNRHRYGTIVPQSLGLEVGSLWPTAVGYNEFRTSVVELYWEQHIVKDRVAFRVGKMIPFAIHDYFKMKSPVSAFTNATFTLNPSIAWVGFGLGAAALVRPHDDFYILAGTYDANGKATTSGFNTLFNQGELLTIVDVGWDPGFINKQNQVQIGPFTVSEYHLTFWHRDALKNAGVPSGWGLTLFLENKIGNVLTFFRYGYSKGSSGGSPAILNHMIAAGIGIEQPFGRTSDLIGLGVSWGRRDLGTVAIDINADDIPDPIVLGNVDQWATELFYRVQVTPEIQVTPSVQLIINPAFNPDKNMVGVFGIRARAEF